MFSSSETLGSMPERVDLHLSKWKSHSPAPVTGNTGILEGYLISSNGFALNTAGRNSLSAAVCLGKKEEQ